MLTGYSLYRFPITLYNKTFPSNPITEQVIGYHFRHFPTKEPISYLCVIIIAAIVSVSNSKQGRVKYVVLSSLDNVR